MSYSLVKFYSTRGHGTMNTTTMNTEFYEGKGPVEKTALMRAHKQKLAAEIGLSGYGRIFIFSPFQKKSDGTKRYETGYCYKLTADDIAKYDDLYNLDVYADSIMVDPNDEAVKDAAVEDAAVKDVAVKDAAVKDVAVGFNVADCMVPHIVNEKTGVFNVSHWGGADIDRGIIPPTMEVMLAGANKRDIHVWSSPFAHKMYYSDPRKLSWANDEKIWGDYKQKDIEHGGVIVDVNGAVINQLKNYIPIENIHLSPLETNIPNSDFYSNALAAAYPEQHGRFLAGIAVIDSGKSFAYDRTYNGHEYIKVIGGKRERR